MCQTCNPLINRELVDSDEKTNNDENIKSYFFITVCKIFAKCPINSYEFHEIYLYF